MKVDVEEVGLRALALADQMLFPDLLGQCASHAHRLLAQARRLK
jgi:hypothetical protein